MKKHLKNLIAKGHTRKVVQQLLELTEDRPDTQSYNELILLAHRMTALEQNDRTGQFSTSEYQRESIAINHRLIGLIDDLDLPTQETKETNDNTETLKEQNTSKRYVIAFILLLLGVISSVIIYSKYNGTSGKPKTTDDIEEANPQNSEPSDKVSNKETTVSPFADEQRNQQPKPPLTESITEAEQPPTTAKIKMDRSAIIKGLEKNFQLGITEVTVGQYFLFSKLMDRKFPHAYVDTSNASAPMTHVSWQDAMDFCKYIGGRLPTVTEWEFAAKGGAQSKGYVYSGGNRAEQVAWYIGDDVDRPQRVKQKTANELGLYDMSGNVNEWCLDHSTRNQSYKQRRGGSWKSFHNALKLGRAVQSVHFDFKGEATGFRVAFDSPSE